MKRTAMMVSSNQRTWTLRREMRCLKATHPAERARPSRRDNRGRPGPVKPIQENPLAALNASFVAASIVTPARRPASIAQCECHTLNVAALTSRIAAT